MSAFIKIVENGPAIISIDEGELILDSAEDPLKKMSKRLALCRCGKSKDGVLCDGEHAKKGTVEDYMTGKRYE